MGPQGTQGVQGAQGFQGVQGAQGTQGPSANFMGRNSFDKNSHIRFYSYTVPNNIGPSSSAVVSINIGSLNYSNESIIWSSVSGHIGAQDSNRSLILWNDYGCGDMMVFKNNVGILANRFLWRGTLLPPDPAITGTLNAKLASYFVSSFNHDKAQRSVGAHDHLNRAANPNPLLGYGFHYEDFYNYHYGFMIAPYDAGAGQHWSVFSLTQNNVFLGITSSWLSGTPTNATLNIAFFNAGTNTFTLGGATKYVAIFD
jgi:hypothetical protein